ncbi:MAG: hypothetical protein HY892_16545 [Deltaproteobacteria bacterium]|nr:hypothetical protein [Deltaproteobacteria bacterium]
MKTRNKVFIGSGIFLLMTLIVGYGLVIGSPWGDGKFGPPFAGKGFHSGFHQKEVAEFILWRMDKTAQKLNLNADQKVRYEELKNNITSRLSAGFEERRQMRARVHEEMNKENPDVQGLVEAAKTRINDFSGFLSKNLDLLADFYDSLNVDQKRLINTEIRERIAAHNHS